MGPDGKEVPRGEPGEVWVRGYNVMRGYLDDPEQTAATIDAVAELRTATDRVSDSFTHIPADPGLAPIAGAPAFQQLVRDVAGRWIERARVRGYSTQAELRMMGLAHFVREEYAEAEAAFEGALRAGGPLEISVRTELEAVRVKRGGGDGDRVQKP